MDQIIRESPKFPTCGCLTPGQVSGSLDTSRISRAYLSYLETCAVSFQYHTGIMARSWVPVRSTVVGAKRLIFQSRVTEEHLRLRVLTDSATPALLSRPTYDTSNTAVSIDRFSMKRSKAGEIVFSLGMLIT